MAASETDLRGKPWNDTRWPTSAAIRGPKGMVGPEERACYYWLGRNWLSGKGCIVDAGCFVGASTFCFAAGAADGGRRSFDGGKLVHAFDYFKVVDQYVGEAISRDFRPIARGQSYLDIFQAQTAPCADMIASYARDFLTNVGTAPRSRSCSSTSPRRRSRPRVPRCRVGDRHLLDFVTGVRATA